MNQYEIKVVETKTVYVEAESDDEAEELAEIIECGFLPDSVKCEIRSVVYLDEE